jgi:hypothetical protein
MDVHLTAVGLDVELLFHYFTITVGVPALYNITKVSTRLTPSIAAESLHRDTGG